MTYCLCCIYFIIFVFFALNQSQNTVLPLGWFFFQRPPSPQKSTMTLLTSLPLKTQSKPFVLAPKLKSTNQNPRFQTTQSELAQRIPLLLITNTSYNAFFLLYLVTQEEEIFGRVNEGVKFLCLFLFDHQLWYFASYYPQQRNVKCAMSYFCRCISKTKLFKNWSRFTHNLRKEMCGICL